MPQPGLVCWYPPWSHFHMAARTGASMGPRLKKDLGCKQLYVGWVNHMVLLYNNERLSEWVLIALYSTQNYRQALYRTRNYIFHFLYFPLCFVTGYTHTHTHTHTCLGLKPCPALCDPMDCSPPGSSVRGISQARVLEWVIIPSLGDPPHPGFKTSSPALQVNSLLLSHQNNKSETLWKQKKRKDLVDAGRTGKQAAMDGVLRHSLRSRIPRV